MRRVWAEFRAVRARSSSGCVPALARGMRTRAGACALALLLVAGIAPRVCADWTPYEQLPGAARAMQVQSQWRDGGGRGLPRDVRWDVAGDSLWFRQGNAWKVMRIASGDVSDAPEGADPPPPPPPKPSDPPAPSRGRQRPVEPSPDGLWVAASVKGNVRISPVGAGQEPGVDSVAIEVTSEGGNGLRFGTASWVYGEELDQTTGMWWAPDSKRLAYYRFDDSQVPPFTMLGGLTELFTTTDVERYPKPGDRNPDAGIEIVEIASPTTRIKVDAGPRDQWEYVYGPQWAPDGSELLFLRTNRRQSVLDLCAANPATGAVRVVIREEQPNWQQNRPEMRWLSDGRRFIWASERSGLKQYELHSLDAGTAPVRLTSGDRPVDSIVSVDERGGRLWYSACTGEHAIEPQLMSVAFDGTGQARHTPRDAHHARFSVAPGGAHFVASDETLVRPPVMRLYRADGTVVSDVPGVPAGGDAAAEGSGAPKDPWAARGLVPPEPVVLTAADGVTPLYGILWFPSDFDPSRRYPLVVETYGGPGVRVVRWSFSRPQPDCELGFLVLSVDNRGTPGRGKAFEDATYLALGGPDVDDQAAAARQVSRRPYVDASRMGITGSSYGGYMSIMGLLRHPDVFSSAVAFSGPTDWRQYDTIYTERYMRTPRENPEGYASASAVERAKDLRGSLLIIHGMQDDNVHPNNMWALADRLQSMNRPFGMLLFPRAGHGGFGEAGESAKWSHFVRTLRPEPSR
jgi:dipeptidyl-peptidase-4